MGSCKKCYYVAPLYCDNFIYIFMNLRLEIQLKDGAYSNIVFMLQKIQYFKTILSYNSVIAKFIAKCVGCSWCFCECITISFYL